MAFAFVQDLPADWETYEKIVAEVGVEAAPPEGLIVHSAGPTSSGVRIIDVWESKEAHLRFAIERLAPARARVFGGEDVPPPPAQELEVQHVVRG
jgi:hypothetical protein